LLDSSKDVNTWAHGSLQSHPGRSISAMLGILLVVVKVQLQEEDDLHLAMVKCFDRIQQRWQTGTAK
jgi:hypothetical protein